MCSLDNNIKVWPNIFKCLLTPVCGKLFKALSIEGKKYMSVIASAPLSAGTLFLLTGLNCVFPLHEAVCSEFK